MNLMVSKALFFLTCMTLAIASPLSAAVYIYELNSNYTGGTPPAGPTPWATATFQDTGANKVQLTLSTSGLTANEFISKWAFNFDPSLNVNNLVFTRTSAAPPGTATVTKSANGIIVGGGEIFDIGIDFPTSNAGGGINRFKTGQTVTFEITGINGLAFDASAFDFFSTGGGVNNYHTAAHIQGISPDNTSAWAGDVPVPEPTTYLMLGSLLAILLFAKAKKAKSTKI